MFKTILVPTDGSPAADKAVIAAVKMAKENGARIVGISVSEPHPSALLSDSEFFGSTHAPAEKAHDLAKEYAQRITEAAKSENVPCETLAMHSSSPENEILETAKKYHCDLIFLPPHGPKHWTGSLLDSQSQKVLAHSPISVLVYR